MHDLPGNIQRANTVVAGSRVDTLDQFKQYYSLSAKLIDNMTKEQLADVARMLALTQPTISPGSARFRDRICSSSWA